MLNRKRKPDDFEALIEQLRSVSSLIGATVPGSATEARRKRASAAIAEIYEAIRMVAHDLDPVQHPKFVFDPTDPAVAARIAGIALVAQPRIPLTEIKKSYGSGVYAIYYRGDFEPYGLISGKEHPVYVGKADPAKEKSKTPMEQGVQLEVRLKEHRKTIERASSTLRIADFDYRSLVVRAGWEDSTEKQLIRLFRPVWNKETKLCSGFGKHGDKSTTRQHPNSPWDVLHAGRRWTVGNKKQGKRSAEQIAADIAAHLKANPPIGTKEDALRQLLAEMQVTS